MNHHAGGSSLFHEFFQEFVHILVIGIWDSVWPLLLLAEDDASPAHGVTGVVDEVVQVARRRGAPAHLDAHGKQGDIKRVERLGQLVLQDDVGNGCNVGEVVLGVSVSLLAVFADALLNHLEGFASQFGSGLGC